MKHLFRSTAVIFTLLASQGYAQWVPTNGPYINYVTAFAASGNNLFVVDRSFAFGGRGLLHSTDYGGTWANITLPGAAVPNVIAFYGTSLFVGTTSAGIFRSNDLGNSWSIANAGLTNFDIRAFATSGSNLFVGTGGGVFLSTNAGASWTQVNVGLTTTNVLTLAFSGTNLFAGTDAGVFLSSNNGTSWIAANLGLGLRRVNAFTVSGTNLFAATDAGVFLSTNNGSSWVPMNAGLTSTNVRAIATSGTDLFAGTCAETRTYLSAGGPPGTLEDGVFRSADGGRSWSQTGFRGVGVLTIAVSGTATGGSSIFAGTGGGMFVSTDNGTTWAVRGTGGYEVTALLAGAGTNLFAQLPDVSGPYLSTDSGVNWSLIASWNLGYYVSYYMAIFATGTSVFLGSTEGVVRSTDSGANWTVVLPGIIVSAFAASGNDLYAGGVGTIFVSTDNGNTWGTSTTGLPNNRWLRHLAASGTNVFAGTDEGLFRSTNSGTTWTQSALTGSGITALATAGTSVFAGRSDGIYRSTDGGNSWTQVVRTTFPVTVTAIEIIGRSVFAGAAYGGFIVSNDNGTNWTPANDGFTSYNVGSLAASGTYLFAATDQGIWRRPLSELITGVEEIASGLPEGFSLEQNYPNPFNPSTTIEFALPKSALVTLRVYDLLGRQVGELVNEKLAPGNYKTQWDASNFSSGVYFYRLEAGDFVDTKKLLLLR